MAKIGIGKYTTFSTRPDSEHFSGWYGTKAHWHKVPKYLLAALLVLWVLGKI